MYKSSSKFRQGVKDRTGVNVGVNLGRQKGGRKRRMKDTRYPHTPFGTDGTNVRVQPTEAQPISNDRPLERFSSELQRLRSKSKLGK